MGYGSYTASDWAKLKTSRQLSSSQSVNEVFTKTDVDKRFNPKYISVRECLDSEEHPHSTPIVVGLDVTASMGYLATKVATEALNDLIMKLYSTNTVEDPALMCAAYGDYKDSSPLQVTQFEADIRIAEQLLDLYFENGGQGQVALTCLWEFLARHTRIDAIDKRGEKGYLFTIGDNARIRNDNIASTIMRVIGDDVLGADVEALLDEIERKFHVFHIMIGSDGNQKLLNGHKIVISKGEIDLLPEIILCTIQMVKGKKQSDVVGQQDYAQRQGLEAALKQLKLK